MTSHYEGADLKRAMEDSWRFTGSTPQARRAMTAFAEKYPELNMAATIDLRDLVASLDRGSTRPREEKWQIINKMLIEAKDKEIAGALVQTLVPGLMNECGKLHWGRGIRGAPEEMFAVAVEKATDIVDRWAGEERQFALGDVLSASRSATRRWMMNEKQQTAPRQLDDAVLARLEPVHDGDRLAARLAGYKGTPYEREARLVAERVYAGTSAKEQAAAEGTGVRTLNAELERFSYDHLLE